MSNRSEPPGIPKGVHRAFRLPWRSSTQAARDIDDEISFHVEMCAAELAASGLSPEEARAEALRRFGDAQELRDYCQTLDGSDARRARARAWIQGWSQDIRFATRQLRRAPAFTAIAILTLALGIGANTAIFSVVHHVLLAPIPYRGGDRIVRIWSAPTSTNSVFVAPDAALLNTWQARSRSVEQIVGYTLGETTLTDRSTPELLTSASIAADLLPFLGVHAVIGRNFTPADTMAGAAPVALLGYGVWQRRYGGSSNVLGRLITLNGKSSVIIGVMPAGLTLPFDHGERGVWTPLQRDTSYSFVLALGRLRTGRSAQDASRELSAITAQTRTHDTAEPDTGSELVRAQTRTDSLGDSYRRTLIMLFGAVGLVLLIACANVANLLLVRAGSRQREFALRAALGAGRGRLIRQMLTESVLLALAGCAGGLLLAWRGLDLIIALAPSELYTLADARMEPVVLAWSLAISVLTGLIFGLAPALLATDHSIGESLKSAARSTSSGTRTRKLRGALITGEIALSVVLLVGAGLLVRSFRALEQVDPGFAPAGLTGIAVTIPTEQFPSRLARATAITQIVEQVGRTPGVLATTVASDMPPNGGIAFGNLEIEGRSTASTKGISIIGYTGAGDNYFRTVGVPLLQGHVFAQRPVPTSDSTAYVGSSEVMINQRLAKSFWPNDDAVGSRLRIGATGGWMTIVGVVGDVQLPGDLGDASRYRIYVPFSPGDAYARIIVRGSESSRSLGKTLTAAIARTNPSIRVSDVKTAEATIAAAVVQPRFVTTLVGTFALVALVLAAVGLYGVIGYTVSQRTREIGVRVALGAYPRDVVNMILVQGARMAAIGIVIGLVIAAGAARTIQSLLFGVGSADPLTFVGVAILIGAVASLACFIPARKAAMIDPANTLRAD